MSMIQINVKKGSGHIDVDTELLPVEQYAEALRLGLEAMVNTRQSNIPSVKALKEMAEAGDTKGAEAHRESAMKIAADNLQAIYDNKFKSGRKASSASKVSRELMTEALRLAKNTVKDAIKAAGEKISHVKLSDISAAAKGLIEQDPEYLEKAKANLEANKVTAKKAIDVSALVSPELVAKQAKKAADSKAKSKEILSATQAGLVKGLKRTAQPTA